jgi:Fucose 4-O-acetylase and related acetyltransferases
MQRIESFDILKGIGITLMIVGHFLMGQGTKVYDFIYSFHMPLFFIVTGYFYKQEPLPKLLKKNRDQLFFPYLAMCVIIIVLTQIQQSHDFSIDLIRTIKGMGPGWFLLAMFWARIEFHFLLKILPKYNLVLSLAISSFVCYIANNHNFPPSFAFFPSLIGLFFISIGYYIRAYSLPDFDKKNSPFLISFGVLLWFTISLYGKVRMSECIFKLSIIDFCGSILGTFIAYKLSQLIENRNWRIKPILSNAGKYSLVILFFHSIDYCVSLWYYCVPIWNYIDQKLPHPILLFLILFVRLLFVTVCVYITLKIKFLRLFFKIK